jgi:hypothetical protein
LSSLYLCALVREQPETNTNVGGIFRDADASLSDGVRDIASATGSGSDVEISQVD